MGRHVRTGSFNYGYDLTEDCYKILSDDLPGYYRDAMSYLKELASKPKSLVPGIKKVIFNAPAVIVFWDDNSPKTIVKAGFGDDYDEEKGLAMAIAKKALGNEGNYYEVFKKWIGEDILDAMKKNK